MTRYRILVAIPFLFLVGSLHADKVELVAGCGKEPDKVEAVKAKLIEPFAVDFDKAGNLYFVEMKGGERVGKIDTKGMLTIISGSGKVGSTGDGGPAAKAEFNGMHHMLVGPNDDLYITDTWNQKIRKIDAKTGIVSTFAGTGEKGFAGDGGPADKAKFGGIYCIAFDGKFEKLYVTDLDNRRIRAIDMKTKIVSTHAGNGQKGVPKDGDEATKSPLVDPRACAADSSGNVYVLERGGHALRVVDATGKIRTVAGTGKAGATGDGGDGLQATMNGPKHLSIDSDGGVLIADTENHAIRKYLPKEGKLIRIAGTGKMGSGGVGGDALKVELNRPHGVSVGPSGDLFISDSSNNRILKIVRTKS